MTDSPPCTDEALSRVRARVERLERVLDVMLHEWKQVCHWCTVELYEEAYDEDEGKEPRDGA